MTGEEALARIRKSLQRSVDETPAVKSLIEKIRSGKATYQDTALYARWAATNLGLSLSHVVCDIDLSDRAAVCKALLLDQYEDINGFVDMVQAELDSSFGIHLAPQRAPFAAERADTIGQSLADTTKPDDVIRRRAQSATATATKAIHDDRMKAEARFRSRAGLKCYITRETDGSCCKWCSALAGRYEYGEEPEEVYHRHDNCGCTVTFENGRQRQDVWSKRTWEDPAAGAGAKERARLTPEQAAAKEAEHLPKRLTPDARNGTINAENDDISLFNGASSLPKKQKKSLDEAISVIPAPLVKRLSQFVSGIRIEEGRRYSSYNRETREIILDSATGAGSIIHELGHAFGDMLGLYQNPEFLTIIEDGLDLSSWGSVVSIPHPHKNDYIYVLQSDSPKIISQYQLRIYGNYPESGWDSTPIPITAFREYISVGFDAFFSDSELLKQKDPKLFSFLEALINGDTSSEN